MGDMGKPENAQAPENELEALLKKAKGGKKPGRKFWLLLGGGLLLAGAAAAFILLWPKSREAGTETVYREYTVEYGDITVGQSESSSISLTREAVTFPVSAAVEEVYVREGSSVKAGDALVRLNTDDIAAGLASYELQLEIVGLELEQAKLQKETRLLAAEQQLESSELGGALAKANENITLKSLSQELESAENALIQAQEEFAEYCAMHTTFSADYDYLAYLEGLVEYYKEEQEEYSEEQSVASGYESELAAAQKEYAELTATLNGTETLESYKAQMDEAEADMLTAETNAAAAEEALKTAEEALKAEEDEEKIAALQTAVAEAQAELDQAKIDYAAAQTRHIDAQGGYDSLLNAESSLNKVLANISSLQDKIESAGSSGEWSALAEKAKKNLSEAQEEYEEFNSYFNERYGNISDVETLLKKIKDAEAAVEKAELALEKAEVSGETAALSAEQEKESAIAESETAKTTYALTEMELNQTVEAAQEEYDYLASQIEEVKSLISEDGIVYAPCNGMVASINVEEGDAVSVFVDNNTNQIMAYAQLLTMTNIANVYVPITISEEDILDVAIGQKASVTMTAFPNRTFDAEVDAITVESSRSGAATVSYTVNVRFAEENELDMYEGMSAEVTLIRRAAEDVLYVNVQAVSNTGGVATVQKKGEDGSPVVTEVKTGFSDGRYVEIISGLSAGDIVLVESAVGRS